MVQWKRRNENAEAWEGCNIIVALFYDQWVILAVDVECCFFLVQSVDGLFCVSLSCYMQVFRATSRHRTAGALSRVRRRSGVVGQSVFVVVQLAATYDARRGRWSPAADLLLTRGRRGVVDLVERRTNWRQYLAHCSRSKVRHCFCSVNFKHFNVEYGRFLATENSSPQTALLLIG